MMLKDAEPAAMIPVKDIPTARRFYEAGLGFSVAREHPSGIMYRSGAGSFGLYPTEAAGSAHHTLMAWIVDDIETTVGELATRGVRFEQYDYPDLKTDARGIASIEGDKAAWFKDPEGNTLALWQEGP
jgi:catechol 2,3-dioxygenase-like lactoylglutathione lyase family enzyme